MKFGYWLFILCWLCALCASGCAIVPRGPKVSHTVEFFTNRADGLIGREVWRSDSISRGLYFFDDPSGASLCFWQSNPPALGGGSRFMAGNIGITVDSNLVPAITATGTAVGNVVGAAVKTAVK